MLQQFDTVPDPAFNIHFYKRIRIKKFLRLDMQVNLKLFFMSKLNLNFLLTDLRRENVEWYHVDVENLLRVMLENNY